MVPWQERSLYSEKVLKKKQAKQTTNQPLNHAHIVHNPQQCCVLVADPVFVSLSMHPLHSAPHASHEHTQFSPPGHELLALLPSGQVTAQLPPRFSSC
jgi:hypothetical protein